MKRLAVILLTLVLALNLAACGNQQTKQQASVLEKDWETILKEAKGTKVNFYGWGGSQMTNSWIDNYLAKRLKEEYDITLNRVGMDIDSILNIMLNEKQMEVKEGTIDVVWINGENFFTAKENDLLFGPFTDKLPNFNKYIDKDSVEVKYDFGFQVEGYEAPYGKAQFVMIHDKARVDKVPVNHEELLQFVKNNPGEFTYPAPPDFTGSAFVRNIIYDIVGYEQFLDMEPKKEVVEEAIKPAIDYFKQLKPYLWKEGKTYPATIAQLDNMFADKEVVMTMSYNPNHVVSKKQTGEFPETASSFVFDKGTIGNTHFLAIPHNAPNKAGALAVINFILSVEAQASKYDPNNWGDLPVLDNDKLNEEEKEVFSKIKIGEGAIRQDVLLEHRLPEMPANLIPIIEEIWMENIPAKGE
ncbi:ABC transporter substrate-binding protein [Thermohalobacter berrensis]|uniref:ABC transporter substrate-binding protein n=1 Tax=Thermohalobacter berrensis TaxID=99594 RepID=A0A419SV18_9FIRM|nr:ABC transporter substrate-binding protein [Thermohalobacter berrensis]RKD29055.1 ABC transporter substrate-binding protein [Thermohalobacter berrensis]